LKKFIYSDNKNSILCKLLVANLQNPTGYGRIIYDVNNEFIEIREEKECSIEETKLNIINAGVYLLDSQTLKKYIPFIKNNNNQGEYYLTDIVKLIRRFSDINIETYLIEENINYQITGVNTQEELNLLEQYYIKVK
jgi:bifunctional N-acetylglucosamine-1-phosphate-uridyltransferase/glucosamine-1-phosphate-acetyltransferase GlmU-like protein